MMRGVLRQPAGLGRCMGQVGHLPAPAPHTRKQSRHIRWQVAELDRVDRVETDPADSTPQPPPQPASAVAAAPPAAPTTTTSSSVGSTTAAATRDPVAPAAAAVGLVGEAASESVGRPFVPVIDFQVLADSLFGDPEVTLRDKTLMGECTPAHTLLAPSGSVHRQQSFSWCHRRQAAGGLPVARPAQSRLVHTLLCRVTSSQSGGTLVTDGGPARLFSPYVPKPPGAPAADTLPMMFYMPGIDGTGLAAYRQFPRLTRAFDLRCLIIPRTDRSTFEELVDYVAVSELQLQLHQQAQHEWSLSRQARPWHHSSMLAPCAALTEAA